MTPPALPFLLPALVLGLAAGARAERTQVFSIQGADCGQCGDEIKDELKKVKGVKKAEFDIHKVELTVKLADEVPDGAVIAAVERAGMTAVPGPGQGSYLPPVAYPAGADVATLVRDGAAVGPLDRLRVPARYTVFDVYADWCGPCRQVDERLRQIVADRADVAVRKLNVVDFDTPLARELGSRFEALPYVIVFSPSGKRTDIQGIDFEKLDRALDAP
ncbi:MAG TPA: cation transporter [Vicinamibacteria bacterium]|nr:cation transporter [Vicinamibacteria bacterium]